MQNFTQHMSRIVPLTELACRHVDEKKFELAREDLFNISINVNEAMQQLDELIVLLYQNTNPSNNQN